MHALKHILPSKKFLLSLLGIALCLVLVLVVSQWMSHRDSRIANRLARQEARLARIQGTTLTEADANKIIEIQNSDTDSDGLKDWEEGLWGTNPLNADSDNNGISDFDEVQNRRSEIERESPIVVAEAENEALTPLDIFTRDFYATVSLIDQRDLENKDEIINDLFLQKLASVPLYKPKTIDVLLSVPESEASLVNYTRSLGNAFVQYPSVPEDFELAINIAAGRVKRDITTVPIYNNYQELATFLEKMTVPDTLREKHLDLINASLKLHAGIRGIFAVDDELASLSSSLQLADMVMGFSDAYNAIYQYLRGAAGIIDQN